MRVPDGAPDGGEVEVTEEQDEKDDRQADGNPEPDRALTREHGSMVAQGLVR